MDDKNIKIVVGIIVIFAVIVGGCYAFGFGNSNDNATVVNNTLNNNTTATNNTANVTNNTTEVSSSESSVAQSSSSEDSSYSSSSDYSSSDDGYERPTRIMGGEEHLTAHESDVLDSGWDPNEHEVSRSDIGDGYHRIKYDDGYFRVCDDHGYVVTWGYG